MLSWRQGSRWLYWSGLELRAAAVGAAAVGPPPACGLRWPLPCSAAAAHKRRVRAVMHSAARRGVACIASPQAAVQRRGRHVGVEHGQHEACHSAAPPDQLQQLHQEPAHTLALQRVRQLAGEPPIGRGEEVDCSPAAQPSPFAGRGGSCGDQGRNPAHAGQRPPAQRPCAPARHQGTAAGTPLAGPCPTPGCRAGWQPTCAACTT